MARRLTILALFLLLGAILNVAVAWGCAICISPPPFSPWSYDYLDEMDEVWLSRAGWVPNKDHSLNLSWCSGFGVMIRLYISVQEPPPTDLAGIQINFNIEKIGKQTRAGWPKYTLVGGHRLMCGTPKTGSPLMVGQAVDALDFPLNTINQWGIYSPDLPLRPIWFGFTVNTLFYGLLLWLIFRGPFVLRRWRRARKGLCLRCAYDLRHVDHEVCPECGLAVMETGRA